MEKKKILRFSIAAFLAFFGLITLFLSSSVIFDWFGIRAKEGNYVLFVVVSNYIASLLYIVSAYGFIKHKIWTSKYLISSFLVLFFAFVGLLVHINVGGIYETKTVGAMIFRMTLTLLFALSAYFLINQGNKIKT